MPALTLRNPWRLLRLLALGSLLTAAPPMAAAADEAPGGQDHPLIQRFQGSRLIGYRQSEWERAAFPTQEKSAQGRWVEPVQVEGRLTRLVYLAPMGKSRTEVHRNYEQALVAAGLQVRFRCEQRCEPLYGAMNASLDWRNAMRFARQGIPPADGKGSYSVSSPLAPQEARFLYGTLSRQGVEHHVLVFTSQAVNDRTDTAATLLQILEPRPMQTGQVLVDAAALQGALSTQGHVVVDGLFFDTGKTELRADSQAQLDELVALLGRQAPWKLYVVGHTDNVGTQEANQALSRGRAEAVAAALQARGIAAARLQPKGLGPYAPRASNADEAGRARNRRVELVLQ